MTDSPTQAPLTAPGTLLVVDDDEIVRMVTIRMLQRSGFIVLGAANGEEGLDLFRANTGAIHAVLLDMTMPKMDGRATFLALRQVDPEVKVILASGYPESDATAQFGADGLAGFIQKPYTPDELLARVRSVIES
jgi:CheY-like chemotaxis protein